MRATGVITIARRQVESQRIHQGFGKTIAAMVGLDEQKCDDGVELRFRYLDHVQVAKQTKYTLGVPVVGYLDVKIADSLVSAALGPIYSARYRRSVRHP